MPDRRRGPGRPQIDPDDPSVPVTFSLPGQKFARLRDRALAEHVTIPALVRRLIREAHASGSRGQP